MSKKLVEIFRTTIRSQGGSLYTLIPPFLKKEMNVEEGDTVRWFRESNDSDIVIRIEKKDD